MCQDGSATSACSFSSACVAACYGWNVTTQCQSVSSVLARDDVQCAVRGSTYNASASQVMVTLPAHYVVALLLETAFSPVTLFPGQQGCSGICANQTGPGREQLVCSNPLGQCLFSSACNAACSGWSVANCTTLASAIRSNDLHGCKAVGPVSSAYDSSTVDTIVAMRSAFSESVLSAPKSVRPCAARLVKL